MPYDPQRRQAMFTLADARGNNPHGTSEDAGHEARRLNAQRYETVDQMSRKLDARAQPAFGGLGAPAPTPMTSSETLGMVIGLGLLGAAAFLLFTKSKPGAVQQDGDRVVSTTVTTQEAPAPAPAPMLALPAPVVVVNPAPATVPVAVKKRRVRARKVAVPVPAPAVVKAT